MTINHKKWCTSYMTMSSAKIFLQIAVHLLRMDHIRSTTEQYRKYSTLLGLSPFSTNLLWSVLDKPKGLKPVHLLWTLLFLRMYPTQEVLLSYLQVDTKTARKWIWMVVDLLADLDMVHSFWIFGQFSPNKHLCLCLVLTDAAVQFFG